MKDKQNKDGPKRHCGVVSSSNIHSLCAPLPNSICVVIWANRSYENMCLLHWNRDIKLIAKLFTFIINNCLNVVKCYRTPNLFYFITNGGVKLKLQRVEERNGKNSAQRIITVSCISIMKVVCSI